MEPDAMVALLDDHFAPWTPDDLARFPAGWQVEILDGTLVVDHRPDTAAALTAADLDLFPESNRFEVIDGRLYGRCSGPTSAWSGAPTSAGPPRSSPPPRPSWWSRWPRPAPGARTG
jgi:hypothetical protein